MTKRKETSSVAASQPKREKVGQSNVSFKHYIAKVLPWLFYSWSSLDVSEFEVETSQSKPFKSATYKRVKEKNLKQIMTLERGRDTTVNAPTCKPY
eukprot:Awhi_evm2s8859